VLCGEIQLSDGKRAHSVVDKAKVAGQESLAEDGEHEGKG
jgi:hypothetical protein